MSQPTPNKFNADDHRYMAKAIVLAKKGLYTTHPNPRVGCVLVKDGIIVGEGWHEKAGQGHAEVNALRAAGAKSQSATAYVTLEPCSHQGKTPPCADALIDAGVERVVAGMLDPNPLVSGRGFDKLKKADIEVAWGLLESEVRELNPGFIKLMETGKPYVRVKLASSLDGRTAMADGESKWITGPDARSDVQRLRAQSSAIVTGVETVLEDDPSLTLRTDELRLENAEAVASRQPVKVILDSRARLPNEAKIFDSKSQVIWFVGAGVDVNKLARSHDNVLILQAELSKFGGLDLGSVFSQLAERGLSELMVESGATLAGSVIHQGFCDELVLYTASKLMGSRGRPLVNIDIDSMSDVVSLSMTDVRRIGQDLKTVYRVLPRV